LDVPWGGLKSIVGKNLNYQKIVDCELMKRIFDLHVVNDFADKLRMGHVVILSELSLPVQFPEPS